MKTARFTLSESCFLRQAGQEVPVYIGAGLEHPVVVVLDADTKERKHLKRLADNEQPQPEVLKPAHAGITTGGNGVNAAQHYSMPLPAKPSLPVEGGKKAGRAADRD